MRMTAGGRASRFYGSADEESDEEVVGRTPGAVLDGPQLPVERMRNERTKD